MKTYHLSINSPVSCEKYWLYWEDADSGSMFNTIHSTDSYAEIRMIMDLLGLKVNSIKICRDNSFSDHPKTHKIDWIFVGLKKDE